MTITPFLAMVFAGYAVFMLVLGAEWIQNVAADRQAARARER